MKAFKLLLLFSLLMVLLGCQPSKEQPADVGLGNAASSDQLGPVLSALELERDQGNFYGKVIEVVDFSHISIQVSGHMPLKKGQVVIFIDATGSLRVAIITSMKNESLQEVTEVRPGKVARIQFIYGVSVDSYVLKDYQFIDLTASNHDASFVYQITQQPIGGTLLGTPPYLIYVPSTGFVGHDRFYYSAVNSKGQLTRSTVSVKVAPMRQILYLRASGNDSTAIPDSLVLPYRTAQKAVEAAFDLGPSKFKNIVINAGPGFFGHINLTQDLTSYVSWERDALATPIIGDVTGQGADGDSNKDGGRGHEIVINAQSGFIFGDITSQGGNAGAAVTRNTTGGKPGAISVNTLAGNVYSIPGAGQKKSDGTCIGQSAGTVVIEEGGEVDSITADGLSCADAGDGGTVVVYGTSHGLVSAKGGMSGAAGNGGNVTIKGTVENHVYAFGGTGTSGGRGGMINVHGSVIGDLWIYGGNGTLTTGGAGGTADLQPGAIVQDITAFGGIGYTVGGKGGSVILLNSTVRNIDVSGGANQDPGPVAPGLKAGAGGEVTLNGGSFAQAVTASGGDCVDTLPGMGGHILVSSSATFNSSSSTVAAGTCSPGLEVAEDGQIESF